jgi:hypothetical protein
MTPNSPRIFKAGTPVTQVPRWLQLSLALTFCALATACVTAPASDLAKADMKLVDEASGVIVASLGYHLRDEDDKRIAAWHSLSRVKLNVRSAGDTSVPLTYLGSGDVTEEQVRNGTIRQTTRKLRFLVARKLKAGRYEIADAETEMNLNGNLYTSRPRLPNPLVFEVRPREVTYLGAFELRVTGGKSWLGLTVPAESRISVQDEEDLDLSALFVLRPELKGIEVSKARSNTPAMAGSKPTARKPVTLDDLNDLLPK